MEGELVACDMDNPDVDLPKATDQWNNAERCEEKGCAVQADSSKNISPEEDSETEGTNDRKHTQAQIAVARRQFNKARWYPKTDSDEPCTARMQYHKLESEFMIHSRLKEKFVNIASTGQPAVRVKFAKAWWDPLAWTISQFDWSQRWTDTDDLQKRRQKSSDNTRDA